MRRGRFSGVGESGAESRLSLAALLALDFRLGADAGDERLAASRARMLAVAIPVVAASHLLWGAVLLGALWRAGAPWLAVAGLLAALVLLDLGLYRRARDAAPRRTVRLTALHTAGTGAIWAACAAIAGAGPAGDSLAVRAALIAGIGASLPAFFPVPAILVLACAATWLVSLLAGIAWPLLGVGAATAAFLTAISLFRARDAVAAARARLALEAQAATARRFVEDYEASGRGWFWETNPEGALTYASPAFPGAPGRLLAASLLAAEPADSEARRALDFHLSARFPFADLVVRAPGGGEGEAWMVSGSPNFDEYGRFLGFRGLGSNLSEQKKQEAEAARLARFDSLTGLPNRAAIAATLDAALANADARRRGCALMLVDLDRFKLVNDTLGHPVGDKLLKQVARRLQSAIGDSGEVGRLGGDEFEAVLPGLEEKGALETLAEAVVAAVSAPYEIDGHRVAVGASVGIALARPGKAYAAGLVKEADLALYAAKAAGRGTFRFYAPEMHAEAAERLVMERDLGEALVRDQLRLLYQPIVESVSEQPVAFEALIRWQHPLKGLLEPEVILPVAAEAGIMPRIGAWVLRSACAEAARWPEHVRVAVNLSPAEFEDEALAATVASALSASGLDPDRLELEISEEVFLADAAATDRVLTRLKGLGVRLALDNFGTGHSGLGHLRGAPLDKIKVDRSFVRGAAGARSRNAAIVRAIVVLAESLGMDTTAEGAETLDELALIRSLGCSQVQGFLFGKPMPADEAAALAAESRRPSEAAAFSRPPRHRILRSGGLLWDGHRLAVRLRNISAGGAMVECDRAIAAGTPVELDLDEAGTLPAEVRWSGRGEVGMRFAETFALSKLGRSRRTDPEQPRMLRPAYLDVPAAEPAPRGPSPLVQKKRRGA
ncbi:MAG: EAL domain-containing protein [Allosphingosinicella sp.]